MGKKAKLKKERKLQKRSDERSAEFVFDRLNAIEEDLADLIPEMRAFNHYSQILELTIVLRILKGLKKKYRRLSEGFVYDEQDE